MAVTNGYSSVQDLRDQLGDGSNLLTTSLLENAINATSRAIDRYCGRRFWQDASPQIRTYVVDDPSCLYVDDISTTVGLVVKTDDTGNGTYATTWTIGTDFRLEPLNADQNGLAYAWWRIVASGTGGKIFPLWRGYPTRPPALQVTARFGWSAVPDEVKTACIIRAVKIFRRKDAQFTGNEIQDFGSVRIGRDPDVADLLQPYMKPGFA